MLMSCIYPDEYATHSSAGLMKQFCGCLRVHSSAGVTLSSRYMRLNTRRCDSFTNASTAAAHTCNKWGNQGVKHFEVGSWLFDFGWQILNCIWTGGSLVVLPSVDLLKIIDYIVRHLAGCSSACCVWRILLLQRMLSRCILTLCMWCDSDMQACCKLNAMLLLSVGQMMQTFTVWLASHHEVSQTVENKSLHFLKKIGMTLACA